MQEVLRSELGAGALGLSTGLEYDVGLDASTEEVIALAREAAAVGGRYISHMRSEDRHLMESIEEIIRNVAGLADDFVLVLERGAAGEGALGALRHQGREGLLAG